MKFLDGLGEPPVGVVVALRHALPGPPFPWGPVNTVP
ncbi:hypothetical protein J2Z78_004366 [Streptomyces griseorubens]